MIKIALTGKAGVGKNTVAKLLVKEIDFKCTKPIVKFMAFADPIKEMIRIAYPEIPRKWLYGPSKYRTKIVPGAFKNGVPLTIRQLLIDLGNDFGRVNKPDIWLRNFDFRFAKLTKKNPDLVIVTDCRFRNEFDHLKELGFYRIKLLRDTDTKINDISETNQDAIGDCEFDYVLDNNGTLKELNSEVEKIISELEV